MRDLANNIGIVNAISPQTLTAYTESEHIDLQGFESLTFSIHAGADVGSAQFTAEVQHSDTSDSMDFEAVPVTDLISSGTYPTILTNDIHKVGYIGDKRYVRIVFNYDSGTSLQLAALAIKGHAHDRPVA